MTDHQHSAEYTDYMHSQKWAERKRRLFAKRGRTCEICGADGLWLPMDVHHKNYDRLGRELDGDLLIVCCGRCHAQADRERVEWEARREHQRRNPVRWRTLEEIERFTAQMICEAQP